MTLLPKQKTTVKNNLSDYSLLLWGLPKVGKSTLASQFPDALFIATESGHNALSVFKVDVHSWETFLGVCKEMAEGKHSFKTIIIDTMDNLWEMCRQYILDKHKIQHEADMPYGRAYAMVQSEFERVITKISILPYGLVMISHADTKEVQTRTGTVHKMLPSLKDRPRKFVLGMADIILFLDVQYETLSDGTKKMRRIIRSQPSPDYTAGDRTNRLPGVMELDYTALVDAFKGEYRQPEPGADKSGNTGQTA